VLCCVHSFFSIDYKCDKRVLNAPKDKNPKPLGASPPGQIFHLGNCFCFHPCKSKSEYKKEILKVKARICFLDAE